MTNTYPYTLTNGQPNDATQVDANFTAVQGWVDTTQTAIAGASPVNLSASNLQATGIACTATVGATGATRYLVTASVIGVLSNTNGTPISPSVLFTFKDGASTITTATWSYSVATGYDAILSTNTYSFIFTQPAANQFTVVTADAEGDGGSHAWTESNLVVTCAAIGFL